MLDFQTIITLDTWVTSDQHWEHPRIREYQGRPEGHFWLMRNRWHELVSENDVLLHLGDIVCFGDRKQHEFWINGLPGKKYLILGNHDYHRKSWYEAAGFVVIGRGNRFYSWLSPDDKIIAFSHEPLIEQHQLGWDINVHGHIHANEHREIPLPGSKYINVSVEVTSYAPIKLRDILK